MLWIQTKGLCFFFFFETDTSFEIKGKIFGKTNFEFAGFWKIVQDVSQIPLWPSLHILRKGWIKKFLYLPCECLLKPENMEDNFKRIYFDFFNLENYCWLYVFALETACAYPFSFDFSGVNSLLSGQW